MDPEFSRKRSDLLILLLNVLLYISRHKCHLKVVTSEKIGGSGVTSTLGTWYGGVVMGVLLSFKGSDHRKNRWVWSNVNTRYSVWRCGDGGPFAL